MSHWVRVSTAALVFLSVTAGCKGRLPLTPVAVAPDDIAACAACHEAIVGEWNESMHARAHPSRDPIAGAMLEARSKREGDDLRFRCAACHSPRDVVDLESDAALAGVSCAVCHNTQQVRDHGLGVQRLVSAPGNTMLGPHDIAANISPAHQTGPSPAHFAGGAALCLACHEAIENAKGVSLCATGLEWREDSKETAGCTSCHMAQVKGPATLGIDRPTHAEHRFRGPRRTSIHDDGKELPSPFTLKGNFRGDVLELELTNIIAHTFPTGFPARRVELWARAEEPDGTVWTSSTALEKVYVDAEGKPAVAPYAVNISRDTRLRAGEARKLTFVPPPSVKEVEIELRSQLLGPGVAPDLGGSGKKQPLERTIARLTVTR